MLRQIKLVPFLAVICAMGALGQTTITDNVNADVAPLVGGGSITSVQISWPTFTTTLGQTVTSNFTTIAVNSSGLLTYSLPSNVGTAPQAYYTFTFAVQPYGGFAPKYYSAQVIIPVSSTPITLANCTVSANWWTTGAAGSAISNILSQVEINGLAQAPRPKLNFVAGPNITVTPSDNGTDTITLAISGAGSGAADSGSFVVPPGVATFTVLDPSVTASNAILVYQDNTLNGGACYSAANTLPSIISRVAGQSFTVSMLPSAGQYGCYAYLIPSGASPSNVFTIPAGTATFNVLSAVVTSSSRIRVEQDGSVGPSCQTAVSTLPQVSSINAGVGFTVTAIPVSSTSCYTYTIQ